VRLGGEDAVGVELLLAQQGGCLLYIDGARHWEGGQGGAGCRQAEGGGKAGRQGQEWVPGIALRTIGLFLTYGRRISGFREEAEVCE